MVSFLCRHDFIYRMALFWNSKTYVWIQIKLFRLKKATIPTRRSRYFDRINRNRSKDHFLYNSPPPSSLSSPFPLETIEIHIIEVLIIKRRIALLRTWPSKIGHSSIGATEFTEITVLIFQIKFVFVQWINLQFDLKGVIAKTSIRLCNSNICDQDLNHWTYSTIRR